MTALAMTEASGALRGPFRSLAGTAPLDAVRMNDRADQASSFLKALSHEGRLMIMCHLANGEKSVTELERLLGVRQAAVSQQLSRLRLEGLVATRREGKTIYYSIHDPKVMRTVGLLHEMFCEDD
jgi:DNA-binding transcriptional ArsR family regulator